MLNILHFINISKTVSYLFYDWSYVDPLKRISHGEIEAQEKVMKEFDSGFEKLKFQETVLLPCIVDELSIRDLYQKVDLQTNKQET